MLITKKYLISFEVHSDSLSLEELNGYFEIEPSSTSHSIGNIRFLNKKWGYSAWKVELGEFVDNNYLSAVMQVCKIHEDLSEKIQKISNENKSIELILEIGVISNSATISINLPSEIIQKLGQKNINLSITTYPL